MPIDTVRLPACSWPRIVEDPTIVAPYLEDASGGGPGQAAGLLRVASEAQAAAFLGAPQFTSRPLLFQAARSSLTGGAIPRGELVLSVERMTGVGRIENWAGGARVTVEPGVRLRDLQARLQPAGWFFPPVPTYQEAMIGGTVSTNAGGAATFKYGVTRDWVHGLRVLLADGELLELERGHCVSHDGAPFEIRRADGSLSRVVPPRYRLPPLKKISAGYHAGEPLDLIDLFIGAEGTLGLITAVTLDLQPCPAALIGGLVWLRGTREALALGADLRQAAQAARRAQDARGPDLRSIEYLDGNCLNLIRDSPWPARWRLEIPDDASAALLFEMEQATPLSREEALAGIESWLDGRSTMADRPLERLLRVLARHGVLERLELALGQDDDRLRVLAGLREAAPTLVAERVTRYRRATPGLGKVGGDLIVPYTALTEMMALYEQRFAARGLDFAVWGHLSDGNLHPNAIPRTAAEMDAAVDVLLEFADAAVQCGGCPLSEHGVGRNPVKQEMLRRFLGAAAVREMREIKRALDPRGRLAPGVLFPREPN